MIQLEGRHRVNTGRLRSSIRAAFSKTIRSKMATSQVSELKAATQPATQGSFGYFENNPPVLLTRPQILQRFNIKMSTFNRIRKLPGFPERTLPGTTRCYRYDPYEVKAWLDKEEAIRRKQA